jgi:hypothetical protein
MRRRLLLIGLGLVWLAGCASGPKYVAERSYPPRGTAAGIQVFDRREPPEPYDRLGQLSWDYQRSKFTPPRLVEILPELKQKAWEAGGDALVIRNLEEPMNPDGVLRVQADVVRFRR